MLLKVIVIAVAVFAILTAGSYVLMNTGGGSSGGKSNGIADTKRLSPTSTTA